MASHQQTAQLNNSILTGLEDHLGAIDIPISLERFDDCWRPLVNPSVMGELGENGDLAWKDRFGSPHAYGHLPEDRIKPLDFDAWGCPNTHMDHQPLDFEGSLNIEPANFDNIRGHRIRIEFKDLRQADHLNDRILKIPVGFRIKLPATPRACGIREMYLQPEIFDQSVDSPGFPTEWYYLEAELFGLVRRSPMDDLGPAKTEWGQRIHCGAPMAIFQTNPKGPWYALSGESDYGAAIRWRKDEVLVYTTLYLKPGGTAHWQSCLWRQQEANPSNVYLSATRPGGFYDQMNPPLLERKGAPEGPIAFININRPEQSFEQLEKVKPKLVIMNYVYDHISCVANMYGEWTNYEGFKMTEEKLKALIAKFKGMGAKVGFYGTSVEQPETHPPLKESDIVMDEWGRRFNAWEPGNWVIDAGNQNCGERLAKAEAEFAQHYGLEAVFVDRLDHLSVNAHPERIGKTGDQRLELIPSVRLGMIELMKQRVIWQRKLNPSLYIGLNNTTQWAGGIRYTDFNLLEGGMDLEPPIFFLNAPFGIIHKQHYNVFFCDVDGDVIDHGIIQGENQLNGFDRKRRSLFRDAIADGVIPHPYEDEIFVAPDSQFFKGWNNRELPDKEKWAFYEDKHFYGGDTWREDEDYIARAMHIANTFCFPIEKVWSKPDTLPDGIRFSARRGTPGGYYIGVRNETADTLQLEFEIDGIVCKGSLEPESVRAWFAESQTAEVETIHF